MMMAWKDKRVLVTGGRGFMGRYLIDALVNNGADVRALSTSRHDPGRRDVRWLTGDIVDRKSLRGICEGVDIVYHLAAIPGGARAIENPGLTFSTNTFGTINLLEESCISGVKKFIYVSSAHVYGAPKYLPVNEIHPVVAREPYAASKIASEKIVEAYGNMYSMDYAIVRPFNVFGPGHDESFLIPGVIVQALHNGVIKIGNMNPTRDFLYVDDSIDGLLIIGERGLGVYNIGSGVETSIQDIVQTIRDMIDPSIPIVSDEGRRRKAEIPRMLASVMKLRGLGWTPNVELKEGLARTIAHERKAMVVPSLSFEGRRLLI